MPGPLVLVSAPEFVRSESTFRSASAFTCESAPPVDAELAAAIRERKARHVIIGPFPYQSAIYGALARGTVVARYGVGYDGVNLPVATQAGLFCTNTPNVLHQSTAELAMALLAAAARHVEYGAREMRAERWSPSTGIELAGKTLAIVGAGLIGRTMARIASAGYQMHVIGCRRSATTRVEGDEWFDSVTSDFAVAVRDADFVSLNMPGGPANRHFINAERIGQMKRSAWLINTARGVVVDENAVYDALVGGRLAGLASDVFEQEPYVPIDPARDLRTLPNVLLVPHVGSNTVDANRRMAERALANLSLADAGRYDEMDLLNRDVLKT
jgi:lactate dehydrogenase-like 2-hydroxyacid dehydrogenase